MASAIHKTLPNSPYSSDEDCLAAISRGNEQALANLFDRYNRILFSFITRILSERQDAEDVLQEVFLQVWRTAGTFDERRGRAFTWLVTLARSRAIDRLRSAAVRERAITETLDDLTGPESEPSALDDAQLMEKREVVKSALRKLPREQTETLLLAYFAGLSQTEIAERTTTPLGTVKTRMRSGLAKLRNILADQKN